MVFWKRHKTKILIGSAVLAIATGALSIIQLEKSRLQKSIVGCNRQVEVLKKEIQKEIPKGLKQDKKKYVKDLEKTEEFLEHEQEEVIDNEERVKELIELIELFKDDKSSIEDIEEEKRNLNEFKRLITNLHRATEWELKNALAGYEYATAKVGIERLNEFLGLKLEFNTIRAFFKDTLSVEPRFDIQNSEERTEFDIWLEIIYNTILYHLNEKIDDCELSIGGAKELMAKNNEILRISQKYREKYKKQIDQMNELNENAIKNIEESEKYLEYFTTERNKLIEEMQRKKIKIRVN